jgi:hypothetical protein
MTHPGSHYKAGLHFVWSSAHRPGGVSRPTSGLKEELLTLAVRFVYSEFG